MFQRIWNFGKRHRKKLIFSAVLAGGAYCAWKIWLPRLQRLLLQRLLEDGGELKELLELASRDDGEREKRASFAHKQQVSDTYVRRALAALQARHKGCFAVEECGEKLKHAQSKEEKLQCLQEFVVECISRLLSSSYTLHALLLFHRVEFNIVGREIASTSDAAMSTAKGAEAEDTAAHAAFLDTTRYFKEEGIQHVADAIRRAVRTCLKSADLSPSAQVTAPVLEKLFLDICCKADTELSADSRNVTTFLPESVDHEVDEAHRVKVKQCLDEARDYLESPQFAAALRVVVAAAARRLAAAFGDGAANPETAPLGGGRSSALAKLNGQFIVLSNSLLDDEGNDFITSFADEPAVTELCELLYFQEQ